MKSSVTSGFRSAFERLPVGVRRVAREKYRLWLRNPLHPSVHFKRVGAFWSVRINASYRALGREHEGTMYWVWIGSHDDYEKLIRR